MAARFKSILSPSTSWEACWPAMSRTHQSLFSPGFAAKPSILALTVAASSRCDDIGCMMHTVWKFRGP